MLSNLLGDGIIEEQPPLRTVPRHKPAAAGLARPSSAIRDGDWLARQGQLEEGDAELAGNASKLGEDGIFSKVTG